MAQTAQTAQTAQQEVPGRFGGMPLIGETIEIYGNPYVYAKKRFEQYGPIFKANFFGSKAVVLLGDEANKFVLVTHQDNFLIREGYKFVIPVLGKSLIVTDGELHHQQRSLMTPAFHAGKMPTYLTTMNRVIDAQLKRWGTSGTRAFYEDTRRIAFELATALLLGVEVGPEYDRLSTLWHAIARASNTPLHLNLPFTTFGRGMAAKREFDKTLMRLIAERRGVESADAIGLLVNARDENGAALTDDELCDQLRLLVFAGYDTTSGTLPWMLVELLSHPDILARVRAEVGAGEVAADAPLTIEDIRQKPLLDAVISETLRLHPQVGVMSRGVKDAFEFGGYTIPAGWLVLLIEPFTQRMPELFADPEKFDPDRFLPPRNEQQAHPYAYVGFGGGAHACLGEAIAKQEMKAVMIKLLRGYDVQLAPNQDLRPVFIPLNRPKGNVPIIYTTLASAQTAKAPVSAPQPQSSQPDTTAEE